jgi:phosphatidylglycerol---prolipoprotein diacylglyceryl transferase
MILNYINWNVDPEIFRIGSFAVRWYGLLFAMAFFSGYLVFMKFFKNEDIRIELLDQLLVYVAIGTVVGARLGHCFFYEPEYYLSNPIEIFKIWRGGLASHGAAIGILIALYLFVRKYNKRYFWLIDRVVIAVALGGAFIRLGNLMNSEIYGVETSLPWGFVFLRDGQTVPKHPTQIYEALSYLAIFALLYSWYWKKKGVLKEGVVFSVFLILLFAVRFLIEFVKEVQVPFEQGMSLNMGQILSIPFVLAGVVLLFYFLGRPDPAQKPGKHR